MSRTYTYRWGDNDYYFGPFTFAVDRRYKSFAIILSSGDDEERLASFRVSMFGATAILALPRWLVPTEKKKVFPDSWDEDTIKRLGRNWYWEQTRREYGFTLWEGHFSLRYGRQTHSSDTEQRWGCFLPWTQWRHVRHSLYGLDGEMFATLPKNARWGTPEHEEGRRLEEACPTATFAFVDYDGEELTATTKIEEREWHFGTKWCKWLSWFTKPKVMRSLDILFSGETGKRKGSWKGGTIGHSIVMLPGELHRAAFKRYCAEHNMRFVGQLQPTT